MRSRDEIDVAVASSGVAAMLLDGGTTFHSRMKAPLFNLIQEFPVPLETDELYHVLRDAKLIVWDEAVLVNKAHLDRLDTFLKDIVYGPEPPSRTIRVGGKKKTTARTSSV